MEVMDLMAGTMVSKKYSKLFKVSCDGGWSWGCSTESFDEAYGRASSMAGRRSVQGASNPFAALLPQQPQIKRFVHDTANSRRWNGYKDYREQSGRGRRRAAR
jgi:hypothetical protein